METTESGERVNLTPTTIDPDEAPGGLVFVHFVDGEDRLRQPMPAEALARNIDESADYAREQVDRWLSEGRTVELVVYNGNSGDRVLVIPLSVLAIVRAMMALN